MNKIDLHMHTTASDGELTPKEIVNWAIERELKAIAITDHETVKGAKEAIEYAKDKNIKVIAGIEIGSDNEELSLFDVHIIGLFVNCEHEEMKKISIEMKEARETQKKAIIDKLNELGYEINFKELREEAGGAMYGRPHVANILMRKYPNQFKTRSDVFDKLLGSDGGKAYVRQNKYTISEAIKRIKTAGGIAILAHPGIYFEKANKVIEEFVKNNGDGIEVDYCYTGIKDMTEEDSKKLVEKFRQIANEKNLLVSGGSDFHANNERLRKIGDYGVTDEEFKKLKEAIPNL